MDEVMLGKELHPDRVIPIEKLYEILNEHGINYSFLAQYGIENNAFAVVRCKDCKWYAPNNDNSWIGCAFDTRNPDDAPKADDFCSYGERKTDG